MEYTLGVDLGTTYTAAAVRVDGHAEIPSLIFVRDGGVVLVGKLSVPIDPPTDSAAAVFVDGSGMCLVGGKSPGNVFQSW